MTVSEKEKLKYKFIYCGDYMGDLEEECNDIRKQIERKLKLKEGSLIIEIKEGNPIGTSFDILFFDWGGATIGNSVMEHYCRGFINEAKECPNKLYIMTSAMTGQYMEDELKDELEMEHEPIPNIFLNIDKALPFIKTYLEKEE